MTTMAKLRMMTSELRPGCTEILGAVRAPASAASSTPTANAIGVDAIDPHAHAGAHLRIVDHGRYDLAGDGAVEAKPDREADRDRHRDQRQIVADIKQSGEFDVAEQLVGLIGIDRIDAPDQFGDVFQHQEDRVRHQQQHHLVAAVEHLEQAALEQQADHSRDNGNRDQHHDKAEGRREAACGDERDRGRCEISPERIKAAVGDVEDFQDAEDERQSQRHNEKPRCLDQAIENNCQKEIHRSL